MLRSWAGSCATVVAGLLVALSSAQARPFTVADSIRLTRIVEPRESEDSPRAQFKLSPNRQRVALVTARGSLDTGLNTYALLVYEMADLASFVSGAAAERPRSVMVAEFANASDDLGAIENIQWLADSNRIAFLARSAPSSEGQVYVVNIATREIQQLTRHASGIVEFAISADARTLVFSAHQSADMRRPRGGGYAVKSEHVQLLTLKDPQSKPWGISYFVADTSTGTTKAVDLPPDDWASPISISASGAYAVVVKSAIGVPSKWREYRMWFLDEYVQTSDFDNDAFGGSSAALGQYYLIDCAHGTARPLLDAPTPSVLNNAAWLPGEESVVVGPTFLPIDGIVGAERLRRTQRPAIVSIDVNKARIDRVADVSPSVHVVGISRDDAPDGGVAVRRSGVTSTGVSSELQSTRYRRQRNRWIEVAPETHTAGSLDLAITQDLDSAPEIEAIDIASGRRKVVTDLNPQLREISLGHARTFRWNDRKGREFAGGLLFPPDHVEGRRYPIVIQAGSFRPERFMLDGPQGIASAFAARALAGRGMLVLQLPDSGTIQRRGDSSDSNELMNWDEDGENPRFVAMLESSIAALDRDALIDPHRVGLIGFSREGMHVQFALTFATSPIAAATIADSIQASPFCYALVYGYPYPGMLEFEHASMIGAPFWGEGIQVWLQRSPIFHLDRIRAAVRFEVFGNYTPCVWDSFAILKRHRRPVELIHIPGAGHLLHHPDNRFTSQEGNVDWFSFWLLDYEDPAPSKSDQYKRWRALRKQQHAVVAE